MRINKHLSFANVVALTALFVALDVGAASTNWVALTNFAPSGAAVDGSVQIAFFD